MAFNEGERKAWNELTADEMVERVLAITKSERQAILTNGFLEEGVDGEVSLTEMVVRNLIPALHGIGLKVCYLDWRDAENYCGEVADGRLSWDDDEKLFRMQRSVVPDLIYVDPKMMGGLVNSDVIIIGHASSRLWEEGGTVSAVRAIAEALKSGGKTLLLEFDGYVENMTTKMFGNRTMREWGVEDIPILRLFRQRRTSVVE